MGHFTYLSTIPPDHHVGRIQLLADVLAEFKKKKGNRK